MLVRFDGNPYLGRGLLTFISKYISATKLSGYCVSGDSVTANILFKSYTCESINKNVADGQTLYKICKYLKENDKLVEPANPCEWKIREKKNHREQDKEEQDKK
jgi:hypothetical protein